MIFQAVLSPGVTEIHDQLLAFTGSSIAINSVPEELRGKGFKDAQRRFLDDDEAITLNGIDRSPQGRPGSGFCIRPPGGPSGIAGHDLRLAEGDWLFPWLASD